MKTTDPTGAAKAPTPKTPWPRTPGVQAEDPNRPAERERQSSANRPPATSQDPEPKAHAQPPSRTDRSALRPEEDPKQAERNKEQTQTPENQPRPHNNAGKNPQEQPHSPAVRQHVRGSHPQPEGAPN